MSWKPYGVSFMVAAFLACTAIPVAVAEENAAGHFQRGFYLQSHENDTAGAIAAYEKALADRDVSEALRDEATQRLAQCREDLQTSDLAQLMPPDALAYVEISQPGQHVAQLAHLLGLLRNQATTQNSDHPGGMPLGDEIFLPDNLALSPALVAELEKVRGVAAAVTSFDPHGPPQGVVVLHPGDSDLIRGLIETGIQFLPPGKPIDGFQTYRVENEFWIAVTHRLLIASPSRNEVAASIARLNNADADSLANDIRFVRLQDERQDSLAFVYVAGQSVVQALEQQVHGKEAAIARTVLDFDHLQNLSASLRTTDTNLELQIKLNLDEGHRNIFYGLVQTSCITQDSLQYVPAGSAAVAVLGLNPADRSPKGSATPLRAFSLMDIGRELFGNIVEASLFVLPARVENQQRLPVPEIGLVLAVRDPEKSEALWNQLLTLPAMLGAPAVSAPRDITVEGQAARQFQFPDAPPIVLAKLTGGGIVAGTPGAVTAAIATQSTGQTIAADPILRPSIETLTPCSSKALFVHVARVLEVVASVDPRAARDLAPVQPLVGDLTVMVVTDEAPNTLTVRAKVGGLPNVPNIVKQLVQAGQAPRRGIAVVQSRPE